MALKSKPAKKKGYDLPEKCGAKDLAKVYADKCGCTQKEAEEAIRQTVDTIVYALSNGHSVSFLGQFSIELGNRAERQGRNPKTGEPMTIAASKIVKFKTGATLKKAINK